MKEWLFFFIHFHICVVGSFCVSTQNPIFSILALIVILIDFAFILIMFGAEFIAFSYLIVYVGAVAVLFLFAVMMIQIRITNMNSKFLNYFPLSVVILMFGTILLASYWYPIFTSYYFFNFNKLDWFAHLNGLFNINVISIVLYTYTYSLTILSSFCLLLSMIGCIVITMGKNFSSEMTLSIYNRI